MRNVRFHPLRTLAESAKVRSCAGGMFLLVLSLSVQCAIGWAETRSPLPVPTIRQLSGLCADEATEFIAKLEDAHRRLRAGEFQSFELLVGSIASYDATKVSPRTAFLQVPFEKVWHMKRVRTDNRLWQPYRLAYAPSGLGRLYWDIEVCWASMATLNEC